MKSFRSIFILFCLFTIFFSCVEEKEDTNNPDTPPPSIHGNWELSKAFIGNKITLRMDGAYLNFKEDGTMTTNVLGKEDAGKYEMDKDKIIQQTENPQTYNIEKFTSDSLFVNTKIGSKQFDLIFAKTVNKLESALE